ASLLPRRFGVDAIILFYDITTLAVAMGVPFEMRPEFGPMPARWIRTREDVESLAVRPDPERYEHVLNVLDAVNKQLAGELPVVFFAGAPFTLACYCIGVGKNLNAARAFAVERPLVWATLLERLTEATIAFLTSLVLSGADAYQLFDSWAGQLSDDE